MRALLGAIVCGMSEQPVRLSARDAAARCGVSDRTIRRWIMMGRLPAERDGRDFRIDPAALEPFIRQPLDADSDSAAAELDSSDREPRQRAALSESGSDTARLLEKLDARDRTIMELAGRVGYLQTELGQAREQLQALQAPQEEAAAAPPSDQIELLQELATRAPAPSEPPRGRWSRFWRWVVAAD